MAVPVIDDIDLVNDDYDEKKWIVRPTYGIKLQ
jgi:hypothetical protein